MRKVEPPKSRRCQHNHIVVTAVEFPKPRVHISPNRLEPGLGQERAQLGDSANAARPDSSAAHHAARERVERPRTRFAFDPHIGGVFARVEPRLFPRPSGRSTGRSLLL